MPYEFNWYNSEHSIIRVDIVGEVSWEAFNILTDRVVDELAIANHRIDLIYNDSVGMPEGNPMPYLKASSTRMSAHKSLGLIITVSPRSISNFTKGNDRYSDACLPGRQVAQWWLCNHDGRSTRNHQQEPRKRSPG